MGWFGKKKADAATPAASKPTSASAGPANPTQTITKLRETIAQQEKREEHIQKKIDVLVNNAKTKMAAGDKKGALFAMKQKKMMEGEIDKISNTKMTLETQVMNLESAVSNQQTLGAMKMGTGEMKNIRKQMDVDKVDDMMDDIREEMELANEINSAIAQPVDFGMPMDDDELLAELNGLQTDDLESELLSKPTTTTATTTTEDELKLPSVPTKKLTAKEKEEEDALKELQAMMS